MPDDWFARRLATHLHHGALCWAAVPGVAVRALRNGASEPLRQTKGRYSIQHVADAQALEAVCGLRYRVYVNEMQREEPNADPHRRWLRDEYDDAATILAAFDEGTAVGTVRAVSGEALPPRLQAFWRMRAAGSWHPHGSVVVTKLAIDAGHRASPLAARLCTQIFTAMYSAGFRFGFIDCNEPKLHFFDQLGFECLGLPTHHPQYGDVHIMTLRMADWSHLRAKRSPFVRALDQLTPDPQAAAMTLDHMLSHLNRTTDGGTDARELNDPAPLSA